MIIIKLKANLSSTGTGLPTGTEYGNVVKLSLAWLRQPYYIWLHQAISGHIWLTLTIMIIDYLCVFTISSYIWLWQAISGNCRLSLAMSGYLWQKQQWCFKKTSLGSEKAVSTDFEGSFKSVSRMFQSVLLVVSIMSQNKV